MRYSGIARHPTGRERSTIRGKGPQQGLSGKGAARSFLEEISGMTASGRRPEYMRKRFGSTVDSRDPQVGVGRCSLVLGECVQGRLADGLDFLISAPINLYSTARFEPDPQLGRVIVEPPGSTKSQRAVIDFLERCGLPGSGQLTVQSPLPKAHGFGTSTADISASLRAAANAWRRHISPQRISQIAIDIEPTDGSMYAGSVAYAHREGRLLERLGTLPPFIALTTLDGQEVDTIEFDRRRESFTYTESDVRQLRGAWDDIRTAICRHDVSLLGRACTVSARINEKFLPKALFVEIHDLVEQGVGEGLIVAHSGSILGLILDPLSADFEHRWKRARRCVENLAPCRWQEISNMPLVEPIQPVLFGGS